MKIKTILDEQSADVAIEAVFLAIRLLKQQLGISTKKVQNLFEIPVELEALEVQRVAVQLIEAIREAEGASGRKLPERAVLKHLERLTREVERLSSSKNAASRKSRASSALRKMRKVQLS